MILRPTLLQTGVVYIISYQDCCGSYVGQIGRNLEQCIKNTPEAVKQQNVSTNALTEHVCQKVHEVNWDNSTILAGHPNHLKRCILEF